MTAPLDLRKVAEATLTRNVWIGREHGEAITAALDELDALHEYAASRRALAAGCLSDTDIDGILDANGIGTDESEETE